MKPVPPCSVDPRRSVLHTLLFLTLAAGSAVAAPSIQQGIVVKVPNVGAVTRADEPVTFGFPLAQTDLITSTSQLVVYGPDGKVVPAQMRAVQRWGGSPSDTMRPLRWVLVDLQVDVPQGLVVSYLIRKKSGTVTPPAAPPLGVWQTNTGIHVFTGTGFFRISNSTMNFLDVYAADLNGDGTLVEQEMLIDHPKPTGFVLTDRFGAEYTSLKAPGEIRLEEVGPLRAVVRVDGAHGPAVAGVGIGRDFLKYRTRYTFYAGKSYVRVQHALRNSYLDNPLGSIGFDGYSMNLELTPAATPGSYQPVVLWGNKDGGPCAVLGPSWVYQDSDGGSNWAMSPGTTFPGFRIYDGGSNVIAAGGQSGGHFELRSANVSVSFHMRDFFENFPKGFAYNGKRSFRIDLFPRQFKSFHWLDDGQQKVADFFFGARVPGDPTHDEQVTRQRYPLHPFADPTWMRATKAWGDHGDLAQPAVTDASMIAYDDNELNGMYAKAFNLDSYAFGWSEFGELIWAKNTHTTGSPRNRLTYFERFAMTGSYSAFRKNELFALHSRDIRTFHIDGFSKEARPNAELWEALPPWFHSQDKLGRDQLDPKLAPHRAGIPAKGHGWNAFDFEHFVVDDLYEYYLLTGDWFTFDSLKSIGECVRTWPIYSTSKAPGSSRGIGWTLRGLIKIWQVTGDPRFVQTAKDLVTSVWSTFCQAPSPVTGNQYRWVTRYPPHPTHIANGEYDLPWQLAVTIHGMMLYYRETGDALGANIAFMISDYLVNFAWNGSTMAEALHVDNHFVSNPKPDNTGVNTWIPSSLALVYRYSPTRVLHFNIAKKMFDSLSEPFKNPNHYLGYGSYHWWHSYLCVKAGK